MANTICKHFYISGRVQGVWYRASTYKKACELGLTGWVRNLQDGRVETVASGPKKSLEYFEQWLGKGPLGAKVEDVMVEEMEPQEFQEFEIKY